MYFPEKKTNNYKICRSIKPIKNLFLLRGKLSIEISNFEIDWIMRNFYIVTKNNYLVIIITNDLARYYK